MYISMNWINDYVDLSGIETEELVKRFNLSTAEIEGYEEKGSTPAGVTNVFCVWIRWNTEKISCTAFGRDATACSTSENLYVFARCGSFG